MSKLINKINKVKTAFDAVIIGSYDDKPIYLTKAVIMPLEYTTSYCLFNSRSNRYEILVDDSFMSMPDIMKEFVVYHELGHIVNGHFELNKRKMYWQNIKRLFGFRSVLEAQADSYAFSKMLCNKEMIKTFIRNLYEGREITFAVAADIRNRCKAIDKL